MQEAEESANLLVRGIEHGDLGGRRTEHRRPCILTGTVVAAVLSGRGPTGAAQELGVLLEVSRVALGRVGRKVPLVPQVVQKLVK